MTCMIIMRATIGFWKPHVCFDVFRQLSFYFFTNSSNASSYAHYDYCFVHDVASQLFFKDSLIMNDSGYHGLDYVDDSYAPF